MISLTMLPHGRPFAKARLGPADKGRMNDTLDHMFGPGKFVAVTVLGRVCLPLTATVVEMTGPALRLHMAQTLDTGAPLKIEGAGTLPLADVMFCYPAPDGVVVSVTVRHMLPALAELTLLGHSLRAEQAPAAVERPPAAGEDKISVRQSPSRIMEE